MTRLIRLSFVFISLLLASAPVASAHDASIVTMAGIVMHLQHYPSEAEKKELAAIASDSSVTSGERTLAGALMRMRHMVEGADAAALRELAANIHASKDERELADILLGIHHHPSAVDKRRLKELGA